MSFLPNILKDDNNVHQPAVHIIASTPLHTSVSINNKLLIEKISDKIYNHFKLKYPVTIDSSGFNKKTIETIVEQLSKSKFKTCGDNKLSSSSIQFTSNDISRIINIIDHKFKNTINSNNRQGIQYNTSNFATDTQSKISFEKHLNNNFTNNFIDTNNVVTDFNNTSNTNIMTKNNHNSLNAYSINETFMEDFPIRDREKQIDMIQPEIREYDFYIVINSNDRNSNTYNVPNNFVIDFAPAPPADNTDIRSGYIERSFNNIKSTELMNVIIRDTSDLIDSSDAGGISFPYLLLQFDELQHNYYGTNDYLSKAFAILTDYTKVGQYKYYRMIGDNAENSVSRVYNPRINLNKLTIKLLLPNGTLFNFGSVNNNDTSNACISFGLRIITIQKNLSTQFINNA